MLYLVEKDGSLKYVGCFVEPMRPNNLYQIIFND